MPQISVNEIDQSVVTRVVSDDKVKVLVPIISSFGPGYDGTLKSINTFTDITDFNRVYGYTDAQFNPFKEDNSRTYATQLIQRGGAVSVVRVNNSGETSFFNLGAVASDRSTPGWNTLSPAVTNSWERMSSVITVEQDDEQDTSSLVINGKTGAFLAAGTLRITAANGSVYTETNCVVTSETTTTSIIDSAGNVVATATYAQPLSESGQGIITVEPAESSPIVAGMNCSVAVTPYTTDSDFFKKNTFCPQIESIVAKYPGSFGDNLIISISQVNTTRVSESYQYASISVYYANKVSVYETDENGNTLDNSYITGVTLLENKRVSTNPSDAMYFEDVEFDFIKIIGTANARNELALIWSNIGSSSSSSAKYSGFPVVKLKYINDSGVNVFNTEALLSGGTDFAYSDDVLQKLKLGFLGYYGGSGSWTKDDVDNYLTDVYGTNNDGIIPNIYKSITNLYADFTDPYVYDFDFITSGGFVYEEYDLTYTTTTTTLTATVTSLNKNVDLKTLTGTTATPALKGSTTVTVVFGTGSTAVTYKAVSTQDNQTDVDLVDTAGSGTKGSVNFVSGEVTIDNVTASTQVAVTFTYNDSSKSKHAEVILPESNSNNYVTYSDVNPIHAAMINLANTRQDCIALCDLPAAYDPNYAVEYAGMLNTSYATIHHPWCYVQSPYNANKLLHMAPSYIFMYTFLSNLIDNVSSQKWFPPAGVTRATARVVKKPDYEIGSVILNNWQNDNTSRVNPIMKLKQYGYVIYGQYTALPAIDMYTHSALESLNVRLISNVVKKKIFDVCLNMAFEPNTSTLWLKFFSQMDEFLRYMQYNNGVYDYKIVMDESTVTTDDINHLRCPGKVYIAPTRTAEFFDIDFIITEAGATFTED